MNQVKNPTSKLFENISLVAISLLFLLFPLVFSTATTDVFGLPKQILLLAVGLVTFVLLGLRMVSEGEIRLRNTPFDVPILIFGLIALVSSLISLDRSDALVAFVPLLISIIVYFVVVNTAKSESKVLSLLGSLTLGGSILSLLQVLTYFKIYVFPQQYAHIQT